MYLLSLIYLELLQNYSGANIGAITEIVKKIVEKWEMGMARFER